MFRSAVWRFRLNFRFKQTTKANNITGFKRHTAQSTILFTQYWQIFNKKKFKRQSDVVGESSSNATVSTPNIINIFLSRTHKDRTSFLFDFRILQKPNIFSTNLRYYWKCWKLNWFDIDTGHSIMTNNLWHNSIYTDGINSKRSDKHTNTDQMKPIFIECNSYSRFFIFLSFSINSHK